MKYINRKINIIRKKYYKLDNQQETKVHKIKKKNEWVGSSETIRKTTLNTDFLFWFIGFFEGDGSFVLLKDGRIFIIIVQNELLVLYKIKKFLKKGKVQKHGKYFRYILTLPLDVSFLIKQFLGFYTTRYLLKFNILFNKNLCYFNLNFLENAWLSGFIDAEGCFYIRLLKRKTYDVGYQIRLIFILDQKFDENERNIFLLLNKVLPGRVELRKNNNFRFIIENINILEILIKYLNRYPLKSHKKMIQYKKWLKVYFIKKKKVKTLKDIEKIKKIKSWRYSPPLYESIKN